MKKLLLTLAALTVTVSVFAQGYVFQNLAGTGPGGGVVRHGEDGDRPLQATAVDGVVVALYWGQLGATEDALMMVGGPANILVNGLYSGGNRTLPAPGTYTLQVRAFDQQFANYEAAVDAAFAGNRTLGGKSELFEAATGNSSVTPPVAPFNLASVVPAFSVTTLVPEPSVIALGVLGAGALLLLRRRK